jgi:hypothetical protein
MEKLKLKSLANVGDVLSSEELKLVYSSYGSSSDPEGSPRKREFSRPSPFSEPVRCTGYSATPIRRLKPGGIIEYCIVCDDQDPVCCPTS